MKFRKKPDIVEAEQFIKANPWPEGVREEPNSPTGLVIDLGVTFYKIDDTDWIVTDAAGKKIIMPNDVFQQMYEAAS